MKKYISDNHIYRDLEAAVYAVLSEYIGDGHASETIYTNDNMTECIDNLAGYCGYVVRYFEFREQHADMDDETMFNEFTKAEAER